MKRPLFHAHEKAPFYAHEKVPLMPCTRSLPLASALGVGARDAVPRDTLNPQPSTLNPQPSTLNPQPQP